MTHADIKAQTHTHKQVHTHTGTRERERENKEPHEQEKGREKNNIQRRASDVRLRPHPARASTRSPSSVTPFIPVSFVFRLVPVLPWMKCERQEVRGEVAVAWPAPLEDTLTHAQRHIEQRGHETKRTRQQKEKVQRKTHSQSRRRDVNLGPQPPCASPCSPLSVIPNNAA